MGALHRAYKHINKRTLIWQVCNDIHFIQLFCCHYEKTLNQSSTGSCSSRHTCQVDPPACELQAHSTVQNEAHSPDSPLHLKYWNEPIKITRQFNGWLIHRSEYLWADITISKSFVFCKAAPDMSNWTDLLDLFASLYILLPMTCHITLYRK